MKRNIFLGALALVLGMANAGLTRAQSAIDTSTSTEAAAGATAGATGDAATSGSDASAGADTSASTNTGASTSADTSADTSASTSADDRAADASAGGTLDSSSQSTTSDASSSDAGASPSLDGQSTTQADDQAGTTAEPAAPSAAAGADAAIDASAGATTDEASTADTSANINASKNRDANVDGSLQGRANIDAAASAATQQNLTSGLQFGQATQQGLALNTVARNSFFYNSGLRAGDVLVSYAGRPIRSQADFTRWAVYQPGQRVPVIILRDGRRETIYVTYHQHGGQVQHQAAYAPQPGAAYLGLTFDPSSQNGALVRSVAPGSPAERAGIRAGQLIVAINGQLVQNHQEVIGFVAGQQPGTQVDLAVTHPVVLGARPNAAQASYQPTAPTPPTAVPAIPSAPVPTGSVETGVYQEDATDVRAGVDGVVRPGDADRDGRVLDGDGRIGPRERATITGRRR